tara:strand:- start:6459 stop:10616 length:4158 start_codon:yes stop_codon:yes gene_type:complete
MKKLFHISDIHIRNGDKKTSRYEEYNYVFDNLFKSLQNSISKYNLSYDDYLIIVSGDIFHNKNVIGNYGLELYNKFVKGLTDIGKTIIFHGNHDRNQNEIDQPSLISSTIEIDNLRILKYTQSFIIDDIGFSYVNIDDTLDNTATVGRLKKLPNFPLISSKVNKKVALFHGTFANVKLYNGNNVLNSTNPYPFEWISEFDFALLGDIHLRQKGMYGDMLWGYAGSLIQQNYGEDVINHGYMIWDIKSSTIEYVNVYNPYGYINIITNDNEIYIRKRGKYDNLLKDVIEYDNFPENIELRCYAELSLEMSEKLYSLLNCYDIKHKSKINKIVKKIKSEETKNTLYVNTDTFIEYLQSILPQKYYNKAVEIIKNNEILLFDNNNCPDELINDCNKKNKDISQLIKIYHNNTKSNGDNGIKYPFRIEYLEWDNLFCYESGNSINFANAINNTLLICGNNGTGKSAIYDIITLAIWGIVTKDKQSQLSKTSIINYKHNKAITSIDILINSIKYNIRRTFNTSTKNNTEIYRYDKNYEKTLISKNNACNEFIKDNIGTLEEFLTCSMITQVVDNDILRMDYKDCTAIIDKASNINEIYELFNFLKLSLNKYKDYKKIIESKRDVYKHIISNDNVDVNTNNELSDNLIKYKETYDELMKKNNKINIDIYDDSYKELLTNTYVYMELIDDKYYNDISDEFLKLKQHFININYSEIIEYSKQYKNDIILPEYCEKPCDYEYILTESEYLDNYKLSIKLDLTIEELEHHLDNISNEIKNIHNKGFKKIDKPLRKYDEILHDINVIFKSEDSINSIIVFINNNKCIISNRDLSSIISYNSYLKLVDIKNKINIDLNNYNHTYIENDKKLQELYIIRQDLISVQKPEKEYDETVELTNNIENIETQINSNNEILSNCYDKLDKIDSLNTELYNLENELSKLKNNKDNEYDHKCKFCCKRPWVIRMQVLDKDIKYLKDKITLLYDNIYIDTNHDYIVLYNENTNYKMIVDNTILYNEWSLYNEYYNKSSNITNEINKIIIKIKNNNEKKTNNQELLENINKDINDFNMNVNILYNDYVKYNEYNAYVESIKTIQYIENQKHIYCNNIEFKKFIDPRIIKLNELKMSYDKWCTYDINNNIIKALRYVKLEKIISYEKKKIVNNNCIEIVDKVISKTEIIDKIEENNNNIKIITEELSKIKTQNNYNIKNRENYNYYNKELEKINDIITILDIIISNFKDYRINLYKNHILKALIDNTNNYIKDLCHENTKKFKLDYIINDTKDIIHINWLINNITNDNIQQTISINQASGFQKFIISLALRMSLYSNTKCDQIFIDEGFIACDKQNLSIVPEFLKNLLNTFSGVIIMSHIDIIKDSMDIVANIEYDKNNKTSYINYNI